jgi:diacylglycerol kinase (ATP)
VVGYIILFPHLEKAFESGVQIARHTAGEIALLSVITVSIAVVIIKSDLGKGHPLSGGMPSGHSALAFSLWLMLTLITESFSVSVIGLIMASLLAQSRIAVKAHTPLEVVMGALLGIGITLGCFLIFR